MSTPFPETHPVPPTVPARRSWRSRVATLTGTTAAVTALFAAGAAGLVLTATAAGASSGYGPYKVLATAGLHERSAPSTSASVVGTLAHGTTVYLNCQVAGSTYSTGGSPSTDAIWDQLTSGAYVADYWISTPAVGTFSPGIPRCGSTPPPPAGTVGATSGDNPFPAGQCTWGADNLAHLYMESDPSVYPAGHDFIDVWGNADQWAGSAKANGWTVTSQVALHSIVVFQPGVQGASSDYGHVAWVTAVYSNGTFQIEEMNATAGPNYDYRTVADAAGESFILIPPFS
jgi:surface antigen